MTDDQFHTMTIRQRAAWHLREAGHCWSKWRTQRNLRATTRTGAHAVVFLCILT